MKELGLKEIGLGETVEEVRVNLEKIDFREDGIQILNLQPSMGKTYRIIEHCKNTSDNILIIVPFHELVEKTYKELIERPDVKHWKGWIHKCEKRNEDNNLIKIKKQLMEYNKSFPIKYLCSRVCTKTEQTKCAYKKQFKTKARIIITVPELIDAAIANKEWDTVIFDEAIDRSKDISWNDDTITKFLETIQLNCGTEYDFSANDVLNWTDYGYESAQQHANLKLKEAIAANNNKLITEILNVDLNYLKIYSRIFLAYKIKLDYYKIPYLYKAFELAFKGISVIISDATFDKTYFNLLYDIWMFELYNYKLNYDKLYEDDFFYIERTLYTSNVVNKASTIFWVNPNKNWYHGYIVHDLVSIKKMIKAFKKAGNTIGMITNKKTEDIFARHVDVIAHYHNIRGLNYFKNVDILIILSIPMNNPEDLLDEYNGLFRTNSSLYPAEQLKEKDGYFYDKETGQKICSSDKNKHYITYDMDRCWNLCDYYEYLSVSELIQAVQRDRNLIQNNTITYALAPIPLSIQNERTVIKTNLNEILESLENTKWTPIALWKEINKRSDYLNNKCIAEEMDLYKKKKSNGPNIHFVETMLNTSKTQIKKINEGYDKNSNDLKVNIQFPSHYPLKSFLKDLIFYTETL